MDNSDSGLSTGIMQAILKESETVPEENEKLYNISRGFEITTFKSLCNRRGILKGPQVFPVLRLEIMC